MAEDKLVLVLPDATKLEVDRGALVRDIVSAIGSGLARAAIAVMVDGRLLDLAGSLKQGGEFRVITEKDPEALEVLRHSAAHVMAQAITELWPSTKLAYGPPVEDGFYYDMELEHRIVPDDFDKIEKRMAEIISRDLPFTRVGVSRKDAAQMLRGLEYKLDNLERIPDEEEVTFYVTGTEFNSDWKDLCGGPHVPSTGRIKAFKVMKVAGAFWHGDPTKQQLQRVYGTAWFKKKDLALYLDRLEEAERRDHRKLGKQLDLFSTAGDRNDYVAIDGERIKEDIGPGLILWHPMGGRVRTVIEDHWRREHFKAGYEIVYTPHIARADIWKISGHLGFYKDSMFSPMDVDGQDYLVKPMNCPFHIQIYKSRPRSYKELPLRWAELGTVYRYELSGVLEGLKRVRGFTQDDAHIFCRPDQIEEEVAGTLAFARKILADFGFDNLAVYLSTRPEKSVGGDESWNLATNALESELDKSGLKWKLDPGEGVFYGPKIDMKIRDALGREWQCTTIQVDFNLPERFNVNYVGEDGKEHRPIMIHRALLGSLERFMGVMIEHYAGAFPFWLAPVQAIVLPVTDRAAGYAARVVSDLKEKDFRVDLDDRNQKLGYKIREAQLKKIPYMLIVGDREVESQCVSVRTRDGKEEKDVGLAALIDKMLKESIPGKHDLLDRE
ncbi:MAG: threonine--tRNA ligase [Deltaproteobacteria bacterium]|nr:threonine--tRNA ligase [Deltaproteobacteria bacterium]